MSAHNRKALASLEKDLKLNLSLETGLGSSLEDVAGGFMDRFEAQTVKQEPNKHKQIEKLIEILCGKDDDAFDTFLNMLEKSNNSVWANELKRVAEEELDKGTAHTFGGMTIHVGHIHGPMGL